MYIERADVLHSVELLDQSLMRSVTFNPFIDEIFALPFDTRRFWDAATLSVDVGPLVSASSFGGTLRGRICLH